MKTAVIYARFGKNAQFKANPKAVIYARSASAEQAEQSISMQVEVCKEFALINGYEVSGVYTEIGSGLDDQRPQLQQLIQDSNAQNWEAIIVSNTDRLSRKPNPFFELKAMLQQRNITLHSITDIDSNLSLIEQFAKSWEGKL